MTTVSVDLSPQNLRSSSPTASVVEVFSAIQGEGLNVGTRQLFIRFAGCDLRCRFCDSAHTWYPRATCRVERSPGQRDFAIHTNPVDRSQLLDWVTRLNLSGLHDSISITGGEPLLHTDFLMSFTPLVRNVTKLPIYLETGGHHPTALAQILPMLDCVGMDLKLPSVSGEIHWSTHAQCLELCHAAGVDLFCKLIISADTESRDLTCAAQLVKAVSSSISVILQPVTPLSDKEAVSRPPTPRQVLDWQVLMKAHLPSVRVIPQTHKIIGQL